MACWVVGFPHLDGGKWGTCLDIYHHIGVVLERRYGPCRKENMRLHKRYVPYRCLFLLHCLICLNHFINTMHVSDKHAWLKIYLSDFLLKFTIEAHLNNIRSEVRWRKWGICLDKAPYRCRIGEPIRSVSKGEYEIVSLIRAVSKGEHEIT